MSDNVLSKEDDEFNRSVSGLSFKKLSGLNGPGGFGAKDWNEDDGDDEENLDGAMSVSKKQITTSKYKKRRLSDQQEDKHENKQYISFNQLRRKLNDTNEDEALGGRAKAKPCWACKHGLLLRIPDPGYIVPDFDNTMCTFIRESIMKISREQLLEELNCIYETDVREYYRDYQKCELPPWTHKEIEEHFFHHVRDASLFIRDKLDFLDDIGRVQQDNLFYEDDQGHVQTNLNAFRALQLNFDMQKRILSINPLNSVAYEPDLTAVPAKYRKKGSTT